jgi:DNA-3-methyladenine glycosylase II
LRPTPAYSFNLALDYLRTSPSAVLECVKDRCYRRVLEMGGRHVLLEVRSAGTLTDPRLLLAVQSDRLEPGMVEEAAGRIRHIFALDIDPAGFDITARRDSVFSALVHRFPGLRPVCIAEPFEALLWAIIGQQVNVSFARKLKLRLAELCGRRACFGGRKYLVLPRPEDVASLDVATLRVNQFSRQKAAYLIDIACAVRDGELDLEGLRTLPCDEAVERLTHFKGVGRWTAEYVLMRGLGSRDSIPAADLGLRNIIGRAYGLGRHASEEEVRSIAQAWIPWRGWASFYWWMALQQDL